MKTELFAALLQLLRARTSKWDVIKYAIGSIRRTALLIAIMLALALSTTASAVLVEILVRR